MVESQAARMGHDDDRDAAAGSVPPALATSGLLELETSCSNELSTPRNHRSRNIGMYIKKPI